MRTLLAAAISRPAVPNIHSIGMDLVLGTLVALAAFGIILIVFVALRREERTDLTQRLSQFDIGDANSMQEAVLQLSFSERVIDPAYRRVADYVHSWMSPGAKKKLEEKISVAGNPAGITAEIVFAQQFVFAGIGLVVGLLLGSLMGNVIIVAVIGAVFGYMTPPILIDRKGKTRLKLLIEAMPNSLDLLTISVEAGLAFDAALARVADKYDNPLSEEFKRVLEEMKLGRPRLEALEAMATRLDLEEITNFLTAVNQSEQMGTSLGSTLRIQSEELRRRRTQRAEEAGAKAPVKMLLPMVACIFPTIFIVLLGPAALKVASMMAG